MTRIKTPMLDNPDFVSKLLDWSNNLYIFAIVVTVLATFGVVYFGKVATRLKDAQLQQYQKQADERIAAANATAQSARAEAATATKDAESSRLEIASANERVALAERHAAEANERAKQFEASIAAANARSAEAEKKAAEASLELAKFKAPRLLTAEQVERIKLRVKEYSGQEFSMGVSAEPEPTNLAGVLAELLLASGWKEQKPINSTVLLSDRWGVVITDGVKIQLARSQRQNLERPVLALANALHEAGIDVKAELTDSLESQPKRIHILVGRKP